MSRLILVERYSGAIFGDTSQLWPGEALSPVEACRRMDESLGIIGMRYEEISWARPKVLGGYDVFDLTGVKLEITSDTDPDMLLMVGRKGRFVATVRGVREAMG